MLTLFLKIFNWALDKLPVKEQVNEGILSSKTDLVHFYHKAAVFYHFSFYCKLVSILECVYGYYNGNYSKYIPPSERLNDLYVMILCAFNRIDQRPDFSSLQIMTFDGFPDLYGNHLDQLELWERISFNYREDIETLKKRPVQKYPISDDVRLAFYDIDLALEKHKEQRKAKVIINEKGVYRAGDAVLDLTQSTLQFRDNKPLTITPSNQEIGLLCLLLENIDKVVTYDTIAKELEINAYRGDANDEVKNAIKMVKKKLADLLTNAKFKKDTIKSIKGNGYILNSIQLN